jgi:hypothetical protein
LNVKRSTSEIDFNVLRELQKQLNTEISLVDAVEEGRRIFDNIKKFVNYLLSANLSEVFVILILSFFGYIPLTGNLKIEIKRKFLSRDWGVLKI